MGKWANFSYNGFIHMVSFKPCASLGVVSVMQGIVSFIRTFLIATKMFTANIHD